MSFGIVVLTPEQVTGINRSTIKQFNQNNKGSAHVHQLRDAGGLSSCINSIFYQSTSGFLNLPLEKMAALLMYRIAQGQYFLDGNKRTAVMSSYVFLYNNGIGLNLKRDEVRDLMWGFATNLNGKMKFNETDAQKYIEENIYVLPPN